VVVPSRFVLEKLVEWGWPRERFAYIPNYVDATRLAPRYEPGDYFLYFGRLIGEKGVATLLRAASHAGVPLRIAGTGPHEARFKALNAELGGSAEFLGYRSGPELHALVRGARAVVLPSEIYENAPMSVLEGMALGKTAIGARIGGIPELIQEGETGWTFASGSVDELAQRLREVAELPDQRLAEGGRTARRLVEQRFHRAGYVERMLELYESLGVKV
jgi:glycosyltransferase involved in cell wall biosynthesis